MRQHRGVESSWRDTFDRTGIVKLEGVFGAAEAARMREVVWGELQRRYGIERHDPTTWYRHEPTGLKTTKRSGIFAPICGPELVSVLDELLGAERWQPPRTFGNVLVTMPNADQWRVPHKIWHSDFPPTLPPDQLVAVKIWALFDDAEPGGGATPQLAGSHRAFARYLTTTTERDYRNTKHGFLRSDPWLRALCRDDGAADRNERFMRDGTDIYGVELKVVECTGRAGDVYVTHPWVYHSIAANASPRPRLMRSVAVMLSAWCHGARTPGR
jgi:hypothetical protein